MNIWQEAKQLNEKQGLVEMAKIGEIKNYTIIIWTNDSGNIPHFHIVDSNTLGDQFHTYIQDARLFIVKMKTLSYCKKLKAKGWEREELEEYLSDPGYLMMETEKIMSERNIIYPVPFSIGFICKNHVQHVHPFVLKILWNDSPEEGYAWNGYMEGFGEYRFVESKINPYHPTEDQLGEVRAFIRQFKVLLTAWWNGKLYSGYIIDYFYGDMSFNDLKSNFEDLKKKHIEGLSRCETFQELEEYIRRYRLWSLA